MSEVAGNVVTDRQTQIHTHTTQNDYRNPLAHARRGLIKLHTVFPRKDTAATIYFYATTMRQGRCFINLLRVRYNNYSISIRQFPADAMTNREEFVSVYTSPLGSSSWES